MDLMELKLMLENLLKFLPKFFGALLFFVVGWGAAYLLRSVIDWFLGVIKFDSFAERVGFSSFLKKGRVGYTPSKLVAVSAYWLVIILVLFAGMMLLGIHTTGVAFEQIEARLPYFVGALFILIVGILVVNFLGNFIQTLANNARLPYADAVGRAVKIVGFIFLAILTLEFVGIGEKTLIFAFQVLFAGIVFALALAFGMGCKDIVRDSVQHLLGHFDAGRDDKPDRSDMEG